MSVRMTSRQCALGSFIFYSIDLLKVRKIPIIQRPTFVIGSKFKVTPNPAGKVFGGDCPEDPEVEGLLQKIRSVVLKDRTYHDMGVKAFVSFVKAYSKHEASYVFRLRDLDLVGIAKSFGLLRLPGMFETKDIDRESWTDADVEVSSYKLPWASSNN